MNDNQEQIEGGLAETQKQSSETVTNPELDVNNRELVVREKLEEAGRIGRLFQALEVRFPEGADKDQGETVDLNPERYEMTVLQKRAEAVTVKFQTPTQPTEPARAA